MQVSSMAQASKQRPDTLLCEQQWPEHRHTMGTARPQAFIKSSGLGCCWRNRLNMQFTKLLVKIGTNFVIFFSSQYFC